ncbi:MAG: hypothetical protein ABIQ95_16330 [Bdellovibrionia bacterium]
MGGNGQNTDLWKEVAALKGEVSHLHGIMKTLIAVISIVGLAGVLKYFLLDVPTLARTEKLEIFMKQVTKKLYPAGVPITFNAMTQLEATRVKAAMEGLGYLPMTSTGRANSEIIFQNTDHDAYSEKVKNE